MSVISDFKDFYESIFDRSKSFSSKFFLFTFLILFFISVEFIFELSYNNHLNNKLDQLQKIITLKKEYLTNSIYLEKLVILEKQLISKTHYHTFLFNLFNKSKISLIWVYITSNLMLIIVKMLVIIQFIFQKKKKSHLVDLKKGIKVIIICSVISFFIFIGFLQIPILLNKPIINYIIYSSLNIILLAFIVKLIIKERKHKNEIAAKKTLAKYAKMNEH